MTQPFTQGQFPFGMIEEETKSIAGSKGNRSSFVGGNNATNARDSFDEGRRSMSEASDSSFVSAVDSPTEQQRQAAEYKLRIKKQKQAEKKFAGLKKSTNVDKVRKEFGDLADQRASDPVILKSAIRRH